MDISSTSALPSYTNTLASTKTDTSVGIAMLNEANKQQADSVVQAIQSVTETTPSAPTRSDTRGSIIDTMA